MDVIASPRLGFDDVVIVILDSLRYDVAQDQWRNGRTPGLAKLLPKAGWERRHAPGSFTYASLCALYAGFWPTLAQPGKHARRFAARFAGSETTTSETIVFDTPDIVSGFAGAGYHTLSIGGVGFFNRLTPLGSVFPNMFAESHWCPEFGVTNPHSTDHQVAKIEQCLAKLPQEQRLFLSLNVSAIHQPNCGYLPGCQVDCIESHSAALRYVDTALTPLWPMLARRGPTFVTLLADHGTAYGEDGYFGHRLAHPAVWDVPFAEVWLP